MATFGKVGPGRAYERESPRRWFGCSTGGLGQGRPTQTSAEEDVHMIRPWSMLLSFLVAMGACFDPQYPEGIPCSEAMTCPPGQACDPAALVCRTSPLEPVPLDAEPVAPLDAGLIMPPDAASGPVIDAASPADAGADPCANDPCGDHGTCTGASDEPGGYTCVCEAGYVGDGAGCRLPRTCLELREHQPASVSGSYIIDPDIDGPGEPFETLCDMSTDGGGWTLVQRTVWDFAQTRLLHTDYATFQGDLIGSVAPDAAFRVPARIWPALQQTHEHLMREVPRRASDGGNCGALFYKASDGIWSVPAAGGATLTGATDPNSLFNGVSALSTLDEGPSSPLCVNSNLAVPWLYGRCCSTCPSYRGGYWNDDAHPMSSRMTTPDLQGETMYTACAPGLPRQSDNRSAHYGINVMEYYLR